MATEGSRGVQDAPGDERSALSSGQNAQDAVGLEQRDEDALIARWLEPHPYKGGKAEYRVAGRGVQMWALASYFRTDDGPKADYLDQAARAYDLPREAVEAALAFYRRHQVIIDDRMDANAA